MSSRYLSGAAHPCIHAYFSKLLRSPALERRPARFVLRFLNKGTSMDPNHHRQPMLRFCQRRAWGEDVEEETVFVHVLAARGVVARRLPTNVAKLRCISGACPRPMSLWRTPSQISNRRLRIGDSKEGRNKIRRVAKLTIKWAKARYSYCRSFGKRQNHKQWDPQIYPMPRHVSRRQTRHLGLLCCNGAVDDLEPVTHNVM